MLKLRDILGVLRDSYCRTIGIEYMHIQDPEQRKWFQDQLEHPYAKPPPRGAAAHPRQAQRGRGVRDLPADQVRRPEAVLLEGGESADPAARRDPAEAADDGLDEVAIGMAHRGRLNVLTNIAGKTYAQIFREFEGTQDPRTVQGSGDVKYHLGTEGTFTSDDGDETKVYLAANPSHLEAVDPVLEGIVRAKQDRLDQRRGLPRAADPGPRRRRVRRPGRRGRDAEPLPAARLPHRRHHPRGRQQPGRLHHLARRPRAPRSTPPTSPR